MDGWVVISIIVGLLILMGAAGLVLFRFWSSRLSPYVKGFLSAEVELRIRSPFSPSDTERKLLDAIPRSALSTPFSTAIVGRVADGRLSVSRYRPLLQNAFAPILDARVVRKEQQTWIVGHFRLGKPVRWFMVVWFSVAAFLVCLMTPIGVLLAAFGDREGLIFAFGPIAILGLGIALVRFGLWLGNDDREYITCRLVGAVGGDVA